MAAAIPLLVGAATAVATTSFVIGTAVGLATAVVMEYTTQPDVPDIATGAHDTINGRNVSSKSPTKAREIAYGRVRKGGSIVMECVHGTDNKWLTQIFAICIGEIESIEQLYFGSELVYDVDDGAFQGDWATGGAFEGDVYINRRHGQSNQNYTYIAQFDDWTPNHRLLDIAVCMVRYRFNNDAYPNGVPKVTFVVDGKKVYDPRSPNNTGDSEAWLVYTNNPVLCLYDYLRSSDYGAGLDRDMFDIDELEDAADYCDETPYGDGMARYSCDGVLNTKTPVRENIKKLLSSMNGQLAYYDGKFHIQPYKYRTPNDTITINEDVLISNFIVSNAIPRRQQYNLIKGEFVNEQANYIPTEYPPQTSSTYVSSDGRELPLNLNLPFTTHTKNAQRLAQQLLKKSRRLKTAKFSINAMGMKFNVGDNVYITNQKLGITNNIYEITRKTTKISPTEGITFDLECRENHPDFYNIGDLTTVDFEQDTVDLPETSRAGRVTNVINSFVMRVIEGRARTVWALNWLPPEGTTVDRYAVAIGDATTNSRYYDKYQTVETSIEWVVPEDVDDVKVIIKSVNSKQKYSEAFTLTQSVTQRWEVVKKYQDMLIGDPSVQPTSEQYKSVFGRYPQDGDTLLVIEVDRDGNVISSKRWTFEVDKLDYYMEPPTFYVSTADQNSGYWKFTFSLKKSISLGADVTWSYTSSNFNTTLPVSAGKTDFDNVSLTVVTDPLGGADMAEFVLEFPYSEYGSLIPEGEQHQFLKDYNITATFVDGSGVTQTYEQPITIGFVAQTG